jgi:hypothetical protein
VLQDTIRICTGKVSVDQIEGVKRCWGKREYATALYQILHSSPLSDIRKNCFTFAHKDASWPIALAVVFQQSPKALTSSEKSENVFIDAIATALEHLEIEALPGVNRQAVSYRRITFLINERSLDLRTAVNRTVEDGSGEIKLGLSFPCDDLPGIILKGCNTLKKLYREKPKDKAIADHIQKVLDNIYLRTPEVELAILLVFILSLPTPLPIVSPDGEKFSEHKKDGHDKEKWAAVLFIKMMWFPYAHLIDKTTRSLFCSRTRKLISPFLLTLLHQVAESKF